MDTNLIYIAIILILSALVIFLAVNRFEGRSHEKEEQQKYIEVPTEVELNAVAIQQMNSLMSAILEVFRSVQTDGASEPLVHKLFDRLDEIRKRDENEMIKIVNQLERCQETVGSLAETIKAISSDR